MVKVIGSGIGLVRPLQAGDFYDSMHSFLAEVGITGVKVDVTHVCIPNQIIILFILYIYIYFLFIYVPNFFFLKIFC